ncbi:MAG: hypothetical protein WCJ72_09005 [Chryseobacterium sp.]
MYYKDQNKKLSEKEWMESVMNQMGFKTKRIDEQPAPAPAQAQPAQAQAQAQPAAQSKTMTDFFTTINNMAKMLGGKTAMPTDPKQSQSFNANLESLGKLFPILQAEMKKSQQAQAKPAAAAPAPAAAAPAAPAPAPAPAPAQR